MIDLYYWPTPNGHKVTMFLEESGLGYRLVAVNIGAGEQFRPDFLKISPNNRMPAIIDDEPTDGGEPVSVFESGAILVYLAERTGQLLPKDLRGRKTALEWLFWQVGGLGPMSGQSQHFSRFAPERIPYAIERYAKETARLYGVLERRLENRAYVVDDDYSIADIAIYPWLVPVAQQPQGLEEFPNIRRWFASVRSRPATVRAYARAENFPPPPPVEEERPAATRV